MIRLAVLLCLPYMLTTVSTANGTVAPLTTPLPSTNGTNSSHCQLVALDEDLHLRLKDYAESNTKLLEYHIIMEGYDYNPLTHNMKRHYQADTWHRVFTRHGHVLLALAFNYDMLSLTFLLIGVEKISINLKDEPAGCLGELDEEAKIALVRDLLMTDFTEGENKLWVEEEDYVCHQVLTEYKNTGHVHFADECCTRTRIHKELSCPEEEEIFTLTVLHYLIIAIKVVFLLFGPLYLEEWVFTESILKKTYHVSMTEPVTEKLTPGQVRRYASSRADLVKFKDGKSGTFKFKTLHVLVDHDKLLTEKKVPIGFFKFIGDTFLRCKITYVQPFASCCSQSIFGSWSRFFLCIPLLKNETACNVKCKVACAWRNIFMLIGGILMFVLVSLPFILRIVAYYHWEEPEIMRRKKMVEQQNMRLIVDHSIFQQLTPTHWFFTTLYILYAVTFILLGLFRKLFTAEFDNVTKPAMDDLRRVSFIEVIRSVLALIVLPFEKFGLCGFVVSLLYLPIALCLSVVVLIWYCIPTLYMTGRFLIHNRPPFFSRHIIKNLPDHLIKESKAPCTHTLSKGADTVDNILMLECVSHDHTPKTDTRDRAMKRQLPKNFDLSDSEPHFSPRQLIRSYCPNLMKYLIGIACIINMWTILIMYAEVFGFMAEIIVLTMMGVVVNASTAHKYVMLGFWCTMYATSCFNKVYEAYFKVNRKIFSFVKDKLGKDVMKYVIQDEEEQQDHGFKYFTRKELDKMDKERKAVGRISIDNTPSCSESSDGEGEHQEKLVKDKHGRLHWKMHSLALFVDQFDVPRIPKKLFLQISQQEVIGCPGPLYKSYARAIKTLMYMVLFLLFVFIVILTFGDIYNLSSTNQLLLIAVSGFMPDIVRWVLTPRVNVEVDLNTYTFHGKILDLLCKYTERWPVAELKWSRMVEEGEDEEEAEGGDREDGPGEKSDLYHRIGFSYTAGNI